MKEAVIERPVSPTVRLTTWVLISGLVAIFVGGYWLKIEIVARGQGKVIPVSRVQLVQPQTNGRIIRILVTEGQPVKAGDLLVGMDTVSVESQIKLRLTEVRRQRRGATVARVIIAALTNVAVANDDVLAAGRAAFERERHDLEVIDGAEALIEAVLTSLRDQVARINAQLDRVEQSRITQQARLQKARSDLDISSRKFLSAGKLKDKGAISEVDYFERLREQRARELEVLISESELNILAAEANALARQRQSIISTAVENYQKQLNEASTSLAGLEAELSAARNQLALLAIRAPADGKVENLTVFTIGGFVEAGSTLMSIVPSGDGMEIEAFFDNRDIGFLEKGQEAFVKFDAFPAERFGIVRGRVTRVGADARGDIVPGKWVYAIHLVLDQETIGIGGRDIGFSPGMTATIDVITGERRLISYFFEPIIKAIQDGGTLTEKTKEVRLDFFEALGMVTALMMDCDYKHWFVADISRNIIPALQAGQCKVYFDEEGRPNAFVTWALVDNDDHEALLREGCNPPPGKWASGNHLWFIDIVAPVGNILPRIKRDLHQNYFADHNKAYAIRRKADGAIRRVQVWKNPLVTRPTRSFRIGADIETHDD